MLHVHEFVTETDSTYLVTTDPTGAGFVSKIGSNPYLPPEKTPVREGETFEFASYTIEVGEQAHFFRSDGKQVFQTSAITLLDEGWSSTEQSIDHFRRPCGRVVRVRGCRQFANHNQEGSP